MADDELEARVNALEGRLELLLAAMSGELRTRRVAVVDDEGVERVLLSADNHAGSVLVRIGGAAGETTGAALYAADHGDDQAEFGVCLMRGGNVVGRWHEG